MPPATATYVKPEQANLSRGDSEDDEETNQDAQSFQLPEYYPLTKHSRKKLRSISPWKAAEPRKKLKKKYLEMMDAAISGYVESALEISAEKLANKEISLEQFNDTRSAMYKKDPEINALRASLKTLQEIDVQEEAFSQSFDTMKASLLGKDESELTLENIRTYQEMSGSEAKAPHDILAEKILSRSPAGEGEAARRGKAEYKAFEKKLFVTINPTEPLPFTDDQEIGGDDEEEDDLEVEGGKVSLLCPISGQLIEDPVMNPACGHTYDRASLMTYLRSSSECPICPTQISRSGLVDDFVMRQRVACYTRDQKILDDRKIKMNEAEDRL